MQTLTDHTHHLVRQGQLLTVVARPSGARPAAPRALPRTPQRGRRRAPSLRLAVLLWVVGLALVVASVGSALLTVAGLGLLTAGTAIVGLSARRAEHRWLRSRR